MLLGACLALVFVVNVWTPGLLDRAGQIKGTDFSNFYTLGWIARHGPSSALYDRVALPEIAARLLPESRGTYYLPIYGPQVALFFAPFSALPYAWALVLWTLATTVLYGVCGWLVWRTCAHLRAEGSTVAILGAAAPAFFNLVAHGQNSAVALACFTAAFLALRQGRPFLAGLAIGALVFKPQLGLVAACVFLFGREWRIVAGAVTGAVLQLGLTWLVVGTRVMMDYWTWLRGVGEIAPLLHIKPYQMHSLLSFWRLLLPWDTVALAVYGLCAAALVATACVAWRSPAPLSRRFAFLLLATVLVSPHLYVYDLVILAPAFLIVADWSLGHPAHPLSKPVQQALYFSYLLPLAGAASRFTHVQASVIAMVLLTAAVGFLFVKPSLFPRMLARL